MRGKTTWCAAAVCGAMAAASAAQAGVYRTIDVTGDPDAQWSGIPLLASSIVNGTNIDFATMSVANDSNYVYIKLTYYNAVNPNASWTGVHVAIDSDNNPNTGFNIWGLGIIGSEAIWENDQGYSQSAGNWTTPAGLTNASFAASPYNADTTVQQIRISLNAFNNETGQPVFGSSFTIMALSLESPADYIGPELYTVAAVPEPASLSLLAVTASALLMRRARRS